MGTAALVVFGLVLVQPIAPIPVFGLASRMTHGHTTLALLCAMVAMLLTAISYGQMAAAYPFGGSAYTYAARELHPSVGFLAGWAMGLDYLFIPVISAIYASLTIAKLLPWMPQAVTLVGFVAGLTLLNLAGARVSFRANVVLLALMAVSIVVFVVVAVRFISFTQGVFTVVSPKSFIDLSTFKISALWQGTGLVALTYLGFDGVSAMADEARTPTRTVPRAMLIVVLLTGMLGALEVHLAQTAWPAGVQFVSAETAFLEVAAKVGGRWVALLMSVTLVVASAGTFMSSQMSVARLLLTMGHDGALPRWPFAAYHERRGVPHLNILLLGAAATGIALALTFELAAELVNFGAVTAFLAVNASAIVRSWRRGSYVRLALATFGFAFCLMLGLALSSRAQAAGVAWMLMGGVYLVRSVRRRATFTIS